MSLIENGVIRSTLLGFEDRGFLTAQLLIDFSGSSQGYGGWVFGDKDGFAAACIQGLLRAVGAGSWEKLPGTHVRVRRAEDFGRIVSIGHIIEDRWFSFAEVSEAYRSRRVQSALERLPTDS